MFNGITVVVLVFTAASAFVTSISSAPDWIAALFAGLSGVLVATEPALGCGARWRFHREMYFAYVAVIDRLEFYQFIPQTAQSKYLRDIFTALYAVRSRESAISNAGENPASVTQKTRIMGLSLQVGIFKKKTSVFLRNRLLDST
ncbi:MAG: hypothetical protein ACFB4I_17645 [Cyanophyceae cyanobacterium]